MARPRKKTLEFFMHDTGARHDLKIKSLERRHGNDGYAVYFKLLEMCGQQEGMCLNLQSPLVVEQVIEETRMRDEAHLYAIIQTCCEVGLFCSSHWSVKREIFSNGLYKRYIGRLEERKDAAERKRRQREAESLQMRINELEAGEVQNSDTRTQIQNSNTDPNTDPDPERPRQSQEVTALSRVTTGKEGEASRDFEHPAARLEAWISGRLPLCKTGRGPNDWDEESVQIILAWLKTTFGPEKSRGDAIAYISKRNHPDRDEYPALLARLEEGFSRFHPSTTPAKPTADRMAELMAIAQAQIDSEVA